MRNAIPRLRNGRRKWSEMTRHERTVLAALYRRPAGADEAELAAVTGLSRGQLSSALKALQSAQRCAPFGAVAVGRVAEAPQLYAITEAWAATHRTGIHRDHPLATLSDADRPAMSRDAASGASASGTSASGPVSSSPLAA